MVFKEKEKKMLKFRWNSPSTDKNLSSKNTLKLLSARTKNCFKQIHF